MWMRRCRPNPRLVRFTERSQSNAFTSEKLQLFVTATDYKAFAIGKETQAERIEAEGSLLAYDLTADCIETQRLIPVGDGENISRTRVWTSGWRRPLKAEYRRFSPINFHFLIAKFVPDAYNTVRQAQRDVLAVQCPRAAVNSRRAFVFLNVFLLRRPESKIADCTARQLMRHRVECETLNAIVVRIFQHTFELLRPNDHRLVGASARKLLSVAAIGEAINDVLMT